MLRDRGAATVFAVVALTVMVWTAVAAASVAALVSGHRRAQSAADLTALAAAADGAGDRQVCETAERVAARNHGRVLRCEQSRGTVFVTVAVQVSVAFGFDAEMKADAKAGR